MSDENTGDRHSVPALADLIVDPDELAKREAENGLRQYDQVIQMVEYFLQPDHPFKLRLSQILHLHRSALEGISAYAGNFRPSTIEIQGSDHQPPDAFLVPELVEGLCDYINEHWTATAIHLAAYVLWRINWIHPFTDGNGRTARAVSYLVLCLRVGYVLPGSKTIPDQIAADKKPYYVALEKADGALRSNDTLNVRDLEELLEQLLAKQLLGVFKDVTGTDPQALPL